MGKKQKPEGTSSAAAAPVNGTSAEVKYTRKQRAKMKKDGVWPGKAGGKGTQTTTAAAPKKKVKTGKDDKKAVLMSHELAPKCRHGHDMGKRSTNPVGYQQKACCDVCGLANLPKNRDRFFHCGFCRFDLCPKCSEKPLPEELKKGKKRPQNYADSSDDEAERKPVEKKKKKTGVAQPPSADGMTRARREIWIPTDETAVCRAPTGKEEVVAGWVEG